MLETLRSNWKVIAAGAFAPLASFAMFHMVTVFPLSWVFLFTDETPARFLAIEAVAAVVGVLAIIASGRPADRAGRRTTLGFTAAAIEVFSGSAPQLLAGGAAGEAGCRIDWSGVGSGKSGVVRENEGGRTN